MVSTRRRPRRLVALIAAQLCIVGAGAWAAQPPDASTPSKTTQKLVLAGGCFWGMEGVFESLKGVSNVVSGYAGGRKVTAHYEMVSTGLTGHAESVQISYDPSVVSFDQLMRVFFLVAHDPTELNRQGPDSGSQYRSVIFYADAGQKRAAEAFIRRLQHDRVFKDPIVTQLTPLEAFYPAEAYHQHFMARNPNYPYIVYNDKPKVAQLRKQFPDLVKNRS
jgi:peptide-methionine (S)-S-oxide reductase